jgi:ATP-dependent Lon protease
LSALLARGARFRAAATSVRPLFCRQLAAKRGGVTEMILPFDNEVNVREDLKSEQIGEMKIRYVKAMAEVVELALEPKSE